MAPCRLWPSWAGTGIKAGSLLNRLERGNTKYMSITNRLCSGQEKHRFMCVDPWIHKGWVGGFFVQLHVCAVPSSTGAPVYDHISTKEGEGEESTGHALLFTRKRFFRDLQVGRDSAGVCRGPLFI